MMLQGNLGGIFRLFDIQTEQENTELEAKKKTIRSLCDKHKIDIDKLYASNNISEDKVTDEQAANILMSFKNKFGDD